MSGALVAAILELVENHCKKSNYCAKTLYKFKKFFTSIVTPLVKHFYCTLCYTKLDAQFCEECNTGDKVSYIIEISVIKQLSSMFKRKNFKESLNHRFTRKKIHENNYEDIYDGQIYKSLPANYTINPNNLTFTWNTDGLPLFKSSKISIWPLYLIVNELPYEIRVKKENSLLAGLWFGTGKPQANLFVSTFENDFERLYQGVNFNISKEESEVKVRGMVISGTCDLPAKALFLNIQNYNGKFGCPNCEIKTQQVENVQVYPFPDDSNLRTTETTKNYARQAIDRGEHVHGVKGPSALSLVVYDYMNTTGIDEMHCLYQGVTKKLLGFWFDAEFCNHPSSLLPFINIVNSRMKLLTPPSFVNRMPRKVSEYSYWKASELETFLLIYSLPVLENIMNENYFQHHMLLVKAISMLNCNSVNDEMIEIAERLLTEYLVRFELLYGKKYMTCNIHLLKHLSNDVKKFGPLWVLSCYPFEDFNGTLKSYVHGSRHPELQICSAVTSFLCLAEIKEKYLVVGSGTDNFCKKIEKSGTQAKNSENR